MAVTAPVAVAESKAVDCDEAVARAPGGGHPPDYAVRGKGRGLPRRPGLAASAESAAARGTGRRDRLPDDEAAELADRYLLELALDERRRWNGRPAVYGFGHRVCKIRHRACRRLASRTIVSGVSAGVCGSRGSRSAVKGARARLGCRGVPDLDSPWGAGLLAVARRHALRDLL